MPRKHIKKQRQQFADKGRYNQGYGFSSSHIWMGELDHKEGWVPKNWCFWSVVLEKTLESPLTERRSNPSIQKEINPEYSLEGLMLKLKLQYVGHLMWRTDSLEKMLTMRKIEGRREGNRENEMVGWHCQFNGHESEQTPEDTEGQGSLVFCSPWGHNESDMT